MGIVKGEQIDWAEAFFAAGSIPDIALVGKMFGTRPP